MLIHSYSLSAELTGSVLVRVTDRIERVGALGAGAQPLAEGELRSPHPEDVNRTKGRIHSSWKSAACWRVRCSHVIMTVDASRELAIVIKRSPAHMCFIIPSIGKNIKNCMAL